MNQWSHCDLRTTTTLMISVGFSRGKRSYDDDEDEDGGWAINEDHSDRLWDSAEDADDDDEVDSDATVVSEGDDADDEEEEEDLFGGGAPRGRRGRPKGSGKRQESSLTGGGSGRCRGRLEWSEQWFAPTAAGPIAHRAVHLERARQPLGPLAAPRLVPVQRQLGEQPVGEQVRAGRPQRGRFRRHPKPQPESREEILRREKIRSARRLRPERRPRHGRAVRKSRSPEGGRTEIFGPQGEQSPVGRGLQVAQTKRGRQKGRVKGSFEAVDSDFPRAQCPRRGYSQVAALFLAYYCRHGRAFFLITTLETARFP